MYKKCLCLTFAALLLISLIGCGAKQLVVSNDVPSLDAYSAVVIVPFGFKTSKKEYVSLPTIISYGVGTRAGVRHQDRSWFYDQSEEFTPVSDKMKEIGLAQADLYKDMQAATKLAGSFQADLIIVGKMDNPKFTEKESGKIEYDMSDVGVTGSARYYNVYQTATLKSDLKIIDVKAKKVIWSGKVIGYTKYKTRYRTGAPKVSQREEKMMSDVRKDLVDKIVDQLYPAAVASEQ